MSLGNLCQGVRDGCLNTGIYMLFISNETQELQSRAGLNHSIT
eukprot:SAG11_NODE_19051_length_475_cov_0.957447_1_plen_42_part_01